MNTNIEKAKKLFLEKETLDLDEFLFEMYNLYTSTRPVWYENTKPCYTELEEKTSFLDFSQRDGILCAASALCVQHEYGAFQDGLQIGAALILNLME